MEEAQQEEKEFLRCYDNIPTTRVLHNVTARDILGVGKELLRGEITFRQARYDEAFAYLRTSIALSDGIPYDEPWGFMQPPRHALGALLLERGRVEEAEVVYKADLGLDDAVPRPAQHPNNIWALHGYTECLRRRGAPDQGFEMALRNAQARCDVAIRSSCFCRRCDACDETPKPPA